MGRVKTFLYFVLYIFLVLALGGMFLADKVPVNGEFGLFLVEGWFAEHIYRPLLLRLMATSITSQLVGLFALSFFWHLINSIFAHDKTQRAFQRILSLSIETWGVIGGSLVIFHYLGIGLAVIWLVFFVIISFINFILSLKRGKEKDVG